MIRKLIRNQDLSLDRARIHVCRKAAGAKLKDTGCIAYFHTFMHVLAFSLQKKLAGVYVYV